MTAGHHAIDSKATCFGDRFRIDVRDEPHHLPLRPGFPCGGGFDRAGQIEVHNQEIPIFIGKLRRLSNDLYLAIDCPRRR